MLSGALLLGVTGLTPAANAARVASTPAFTGGTPRIPTGKAPGTPTPTVVNPSVQVGSGKTPHIAVDDGGTAYITWTSETKNPAGEEGIGFCRLPRGATACANPAETSVIFPNKGAYGPGDDPGYNTESGSGPYPLVFGDQLFIFDTRGSSYVTPDGSSSTTVIAFTSTNAGDSFSPPSPVAKDLMLATNPVRFGSDDNPSIALYGTALDSKASCSGGRVRLAVVQGGAFTSSEISFPGAADAEGGGGNHAAALSPLPNGGLAVGYRGCDDGSPSAVRRFTGTGVPGSIDDFSPPQILRAPSSLGTGLNGLGFGPNGLVAATLTVESSVPTSAAVPLDPLGRDVPFTTDKATQPHLAVAGGRPGGALVASYVNESDKASGLYVTASADGRTFPATTKLQDGASLATYGDLAAAPDAGGTAVWIDASTSGPIRAGSFGNPAKSTLPGLPGTVPGEGPGSVGPVKEARRLAFGAVEVTTANGAGAFLPGIGAANKGKSVSNAAILFNGLLITPLNGSQLVFRIDKSAKSLTLYSTGQASVEVPSKTAGNILLFQGQLKETILTATEGKPFLDFTPPPGQSRFPVNVKGFPVSSDIVPVAYKGGAKIPIKLDLGPQLLGASGDATLVVTKDGGLTINSLRFHTDAIDLGPVRLKELNVTWTLQGNVWTGTGGIELPSDIEANLSVTFDSQSFAAQFSVSKFPGIPLFAPPPIAYLHEVHGGVAVNRPTPPPDGPRRLLVINGGVKVGVLPISPVPAPGIFALDLDGTVTLTFDPNLFVFRVDGTLLLLSKVPLAKAYFEANSTGVVKAGGLVGLDLKIISASFSADFAVGVPDRFEAAIKADACLHLELADPCATVAGHASNVGVGVCGSFGPFGTYSASTRWGGSTADLNRADDCNGAFKSISVGLLRSESAAKARQVVSPPGTKHLSINAFSADGTPDVDLVDPTGAVVPLTAPGAEVRSPPAHQVAIFVDDPKPGTYSVVARPGSPALTTLHAAVPIAAPTIRASLRKGPGTRRTIRYRVAGDPSFTASFLERTRSGDIPLGKPGRSGSLRFAPNAMISGNHIIIARFLTPDGLVTGEKRVATFFQPSPPRLVAARKVRVIRSGRSLKVKVTRRGRARFPFAVKVKYGGGGVAAAMITKGASATRVPAPRPALNNPGSTTVTVRPVSPAGRQGPRKVAVIKGTALQKKARPKKTPRTKKRRR